MRYIAVVVDLQKKVDFKKIKTIAEIGIGYGGLAAILSQIYPQLEFHFYDIPKVQELTKRYLQKIKLPINSRNKDIYNLQESEYDLVISNYAFSELPKEVQSKYLALIISKARNGYMIMNSGRGNKTGRNFGKLSIDEILTYIPKAEITEEFPNTGPDNYLIAWKNSSP